MSAVCIKPTMVQAVQSGCNDQIETEGVAALYSDGTQGSFDPARLVRRKAGKEIIG